MAAKAKRAPATDAREARGLLEWAQKRGIQLQQVTVGQVLIVVASMDPARTSSRPDAHPSRRPHGPRQSAATMTDQDAATSLYRQMGGAAFEELQKLGMIDHDGSTSEDDDEDEPTVAAGE